MLSCEVYITRYILFNSNSTHNTNTKMIFTARQSCF